LDEGLTKGRFKEGQSKIGKKEGKLVNSLKPLGTKEGPFQKKGKLEPGQIALGS